MLVSESTKNNIHEEQTSNNATMTVDNLSDNMPDLEDSTKRPQSLPLQTPSSENSITNKPDEAETDNLTKVDEACSSVLSLKEDTQTSISPCTPKPAPKSEYHIKWVQWNQKKTPMVTQNENGPCPLIAIVNVLIFKGRISIPSLVEIVTTDQLMEFIVNCILDSVPKNIPEGAQLNYEQNMNDAMSVLPKLQTGLDVNVKFTGVSDFEYTPECIIFDLLQIPLYHGWLLDPQLTNVLTAVGNCSYNQLVEKIINNKTSDRHEVVTEALIAEGFLEKTASQLTYHGLCELTAVLKEDELCVLFRNNHFIVLHKHNNELFQLVTDQGFLTETNVVWETLNNIEGDGQFVDSNFVTVPPKIAPEGPISLAENVGTEQQVDQDYLVALSLQQEQQSHRKKDLEWESFKEENLGATKNMTDEELARRLQEEEQRLAAECSSPGSGQSVSTVSHATRPGNTPSPTRESVRNRNNRECIIL